MRFCKRLGETVRQMIPVLLLLFVSVVSGCSANPDASGDNETLLLENYLRSMWGTQLSPDEQQRQNNLATVRREELIAQCMNEAGFEYIPRASEISEVSLIVIGEDDFRPDDRDWVSQFGYGLVNQPWERQATMNVDRTQPTDPNVEIVLNLSELERAAYQDALWGIRGEGSSGSEETETRGCYGWAQTQLQASDPMRLVNSEEFAPLFEAITEFYESLNSNPEFIQLNYEWSFCMAAAGYPGFEFQVDAQKHAASQTLKLGIPIDPASPIRREMAEQEVGLALADLDCREQTQFRERQNAITRAAELQFVKDYRGQLEALKSAAEQIS